MGLWRREGKRSQAGDYAWAHDPSLSQGVIDDAPPGTVLLSRWRPPEPFADGWHGAEPEGRWTGAAAAFPVGAEDAWSQLRIACVNHHPVAQTVDFALGTETRRAVIAPREDQEVILPHSVGGERLSITCTPIKPSTYGADDERELGVFVRSIQIV